MMNKVKEFFKKYGRYIFVFILVFLIYEVFGYGMTYGDPIWSYGFSYAIKSGQIPYLDFNTISTPLYAFIMSLGLHIFDNYLMFILEQSLLVTVVFCFLYKMYGKKSYFVLLGLVCLCFYGLLPTYNFGCFAMMVFLLYLEKFHNDKDYLIGIFIGLCILAKHTVGAFLVLPTLIIYFKDFKKILKRGCGALIVGSIFVGYLLINGAFLDFINLCFGGLLDFSSSNGKPFSFWFFLSFIILFIMIGVLIKDRKNIINWYLIFTFMFVVPIFDICHFALYLGCFVMMIIPYIKFNKYENYFCNLSIIITIMCCFINLIMGMSYGPVFMSDINKFNFTLNSKYSYEKNLDVENFLNKYDDAVILSYHKMFYDISNNNKLDYYDVLMYGNFGYDGLNSMIEDIKSMNDKYILIDMTSYEKDGEYDQFAKEIAEYVMETCEKVDSKYGFDVYYKK